jgi:hypothetical protein
VVAAAVGAKYAEDLCKALAETTMVSLAAEADLAETNAVPRRKPETKAAAVVFRVFTLTPFVRNISRTIDRLIGL